MFGCLKYQPTCEAGCAVAWIVCCLVGLRRVTGTPLEYLPFDNHFPHFHFSPSSYLFLPSFSTFSFFPYIVINFPLFSYISPSFTLFLTLSPYFSLFSPISPSLALFLPLSPYFSLFRPISRQNKYHLGTMYYMVSKDNSQINLILQDNFMKS